MIKSDSVVPLYKQIVHRLSDAISSGEYKAGDKLPTETELMEEYGVSRITVRAAIKEMEEAGMVVRARGKGTFVSTEKQMYAANDQESFSRCCELAGKKASTVTLELVFEYPSIGDARFLGISDQEAVLRSRRLRAVNGVSTMLETNSYSDALGFLEHEDLSGSLIEILARHGVELGDVVRTLEVCYANEYEAECLGVEVGSALLLFVDKRCDANGSPLFISRQVYCTERLKFYL